jgi:hypothetical protein
MSRKLNPTVLSLIALGMAASPENFYTAKPIKSPKHETPQSEESKKFYVDKAEEKRKRKKSKLVKF